MSQGAAMKKRKTWTDAHRTPGYEPPEGPTVTLDGYYWNLKVSGRKYDPSQPRVPAGDPRGGQWTSGEGIGWNGDPEDLDFADRARWDEREVQIKDMAKAGSILARQIGGQSVLSASRYAGITNHLRAIERLMGDPLVVWENVADLDQYAISPKARGWTKPEQWEGVIRDRMPPFQPMYPTRSEVARRRQAEWETGADLPDYMPEDLRREIMAQRRARKP